MEQEVDETEDIEIIDIDKLKDPRREKKPAWKRSRYIKDNRILETTTPEMLYHMVLKVKNTRDKAFIIMLYLTACRIEELCQYQGIKWGKKTVLMVKEGHNAKKNKKWPDYKKKKFIGNPGLSIKKDAINKELDHRGRNIVTFRIRNLKNKTERIKVIPLVLEKEIDKKMFQLIEQYVQVLDDEEELFEFKKGNGERIVNMIKWNPHSLRALRLTHLVKYNNFSDQKLKTFAGWSDSRPSKHYIKIGWEDLVESM